MQTPTTLRGHDGVFDGDIRRGTPLATGRAYRAVKIVTGPSNTQRRVPTAAIRAGLLNG